MNNKLNPNDMMNNAINVDRETLTLAALDDLVKDYVEKRAAYDEAKKISNEKNYLSQQAKIKLLAALDAAEKKKYSVKGVGSVTKTSRLVVRVPKSIPEKLAFFEYLRKRKVFDQLVTVNSATLNSFYNAEVEAATEKGIFPFSIPGIEEPTEQTNITLRKDKVSHAKKEK